MKQKIYKFKHLKIQPVDFVNDSFWSETDTIKISDYLWMKNNYCPEVWIKGAYSKDYLFLHFIVMEEKIRASFTKTGDPVFKDSCVEFFINPFPAYQEEYFNLELNPLGTIKMGYGIKRVRKYLVDEDLNDMKVFSTVKQPVKGKYGSDRWELKTAIPINIIEIFCGRSFAGTEAIGNFYKCGDDTEFRHYGVWNLIDSPKPDFHLPEFFGRIVF